MQLRLSVGTRREAIKLVKLERQPVYVHFKIHLRVGKTVLILISSKAQMELGYK